jgi:hypothetical protein
MGVLVVADFGIASFQLFRAVCEWKKGMKEAPIC